MGKRIIFCADGTWDDPMQATNVYAMFKAITTSSGQVAYYDDGVGSDGTPLQKLAGGAIGDGLFQKIQDGYTKIAHAYDQDDEIFIFGFSRGAYTARSIAGMIAICGLPTGNFSDQFVNDAFQAYRNPGQRAAFLQTYNPYDAKIKMVGVWDTVGSLGIPAIFGGINLAQYGFLDTNLHPDVLNAYQALAIDERRQQFPPTLWTPPMPPVAGQVLQQVWFSGVHCDVGGGYSDDDSLSDITFGWMLSNAVALGLQVDPTVSAQYCGPNYPSLSAAYALGTLHDSWNVLWLFPKSRTIAQTSTLGDSVAIRCQFDGDYSPGNLTLNNGIPANTYGIAPVVTPVPVGQ
jgi:uncharacterized protein (DUF2235 family)